MEDKTNKSNFAPHMEDLSPISTLERLDDTDYTERILNAEKKIRGRKCWGYTQSFGVDFQETFAPIAKDYTQSFVVDYQETSTLVAVDYQETFALVVKLNTVRVILSLEANQDWSLLQFDVTNAFLHGDLKVLSISLDKLGMCDIHAPT